MPSTPRLSTPDFSVTSEWCSYFDRNAVTGHVENPRQLLRNVYDWETDGVDLQLDWQFDLGPGELGVNWLVSWVHAVEVGADVEGNTVPAENRVGTIGSRFTGSFGIGEALPKWKTNLHVDYSWQDLTVGATWRYIDAMTDIDATLSPRFRIPSINYFDLNAGYEFSAGVLTGLELRVGVENFTDEQPPIFPSFVQANTDTSQYDPFGRRYYANLRYSF